MNTKEIQRALTIPGITGCTKFLGVFAADQLPSRVSLSSFPCCLVANTDISRGMGEHWTAFHFPSPKWLEFFDSYGQHPTSHEHFSKFVSQWDTSYIKWNKIELQCGISSVCGQYCIFFLILRTAHNVPMYKIATTLRSLPLMQSDGMVAVFVDRLLKIDKPVFDGALISSHLCHAMGLS